MNQGRRAKIQRIVDSLQEVIDEEQNAYDNMPENLRESDKGDKVSESLYELNEAKDILSEAVED